MLNSVKEYESKNWLFYNTADLTSQESEAIARAKEINGYLYTTFVFRKDLPAYGKALTALYADGTNMDEINGASMYLDPSGS